MLEVFTIGGGEYVVNVLNAVAAWSGSGGFRGLIQVVLVMGLAYSLVVTAFSLDWRAWFNWFLQSTMIYGMLMVPSVTVRVVDRVDPGLAPAVVGNVPLGLGLMASFTSQIGDYLTRSAETVFVMPSALSLSTNGMVYGARLFDKAQTFQITNSAFRANLDEHMKQCVFYDVMLGFKSMDELMRSQDLWTALAPGSPARAQKWITSPGDGTTSSSVITCQAAYTELNRVYDSQVEAEMLPFAKTAFPKLVDAAALDKLRADLPVTANQLHGSTAADAVKYLRQVSMIDAFRAARESFSDADWDAYASQRAEAQARNTYTSIAQQAMTWVPVLNVVLTVVFYAMFPVIFPLFLFPRTGVPTLKGYATGFFYLAAWGPLYVVLHMFVMNRAADAVAAVAPGGLTLLVSDGVQAVNNDIATVAGFLMMSVPFLAAGMARGALAISGQATSMLAPAQSAAEAAAVERTTGNYAYGNTSFANTTANTFQANKFDDQFKYNSGSPVSSFHNPDGGVAYSFASGASAFDTSPGLSKLAFTPSRTSAFDQQMSQALSEGQSNTQQLRSAASHSWQATASRATDLLDTAETRRSSSTETGSGFNNSVAKMTDVSRSLSSALSSRFGLSEADSDLIARTSTTTGSAQAGLEAFAKKEGKVFGGRGNAGIGMTFSSAAARTTGRNISAEEALSEVQDYVNREVNTTQAKSAREDFMRQTSSSGDSEVRSLSEKLGTSINESRSASSEASRAEENYQRVSRDVNESARAGYSLNSNETQEFVTYANERLLDDPMLAQVGWRPGMVMPQNRAQEQVRDILLGEFMDRRVAAVREELGLDIPDRLDTSLQGPGVTTGSGVVQWGERSAAGLRSQGPDVAVRSDSRDRALADEIPDRILGASARITGGALEIGNNVDAARERGGEIRATVGDRNDRRVISTMPGVEGAVDWVREKLGGSQSEVVPLDRGERPTLPVSGQIRSGMGGRIDPITGQQGRHNGIDIAAAAGTPIRPTASGTVVKNDYQVGGAGNYVVLRHDDGSQSKYFHMQSRSKLDEGDRVEAGSVIGLVGSTGKSTGPHLHYELWKDGSPVDPRRHQLKD